MHEIRHSHKKIEIIIRIFNKLSRIDMEIGFSTKICIGHKNYVKQIQGCTKFIPFPDLIANIQSLTWYADMVCNAYL